MSTGEEARAEAYRDLVAVRHQWAAAMALLASTATVGAEALQNSDPRDPGQMYGVARRIRDAVQQVADAHYGYQRVYRRWIEVAGGHDPRNEAGVP